jgi:arsenate reductase
METGKVVFVCLHGAAKSVIAASVFDRLAQARGLDVRATFAGTEPDPRISPTVVHNLHAEGVDLGGERPRHVTRDELARARHIVSFGCDLTDLTGAASVERWDDVPAVSDDYRKARDIIAGRVEALVEHLAAELDTPR